MHSIIKTAWLPVVFVAGLAGCDNNKKNVDDYDYEPDVPLYELNGRWESQCVELQKERSKEIVGYGKMRLRFQEAGRQSLLDIVPIGNTVSCKAPMIPIPNESDTALILGSEIKGDEPKAYGLHIKSNLVVTGVFDFSNHDYFLTVTLLDADTFRITEVDSAAISDGEAASSQLKQLIFERR